MKKGIMMPVFESLAEWLAAALPEYLLTQFHST
jgi:hypothetical protein